jgi:hypothetical protein
MFWGEAVVRGNFCLAAALTTQICCTAIQAAEVTAAPKAVIKEFVVSGNTLLAELDATL